MKNKTVRFLNILLSVVCIINYIEALIESQNNSGWLVASFLSLYVLIIEWDDGTKRNN